MTTLNVYHIALMELIETLLFILQIIPVIIAIKQYEIAHLVQIQQNVNFLLT